MSIELPLPDPPDTPDLPKTGGEKFYDALQFIVGKATIIAVTAGLAYIARYGKDSYRGVPNYLKRFQNWFHGKLITHAVKPLNGDSEQTARVAAAAANTTIICHGGNAFAPIMKWMENGRENIANWYNRRWGKPGETEIAHERLKDTPKQSWGDIIKGRSAAWGLVFSSFMAADLAAGKDKKTGMYYFDKYEEWFGRKLAGLSKTGREIAAVPLGKALTKTQDASKLYRFGKIVALDFYATSAAIVIWNFISRSSAQKRHEKNSREEKEPEKFSPSMRKYSEGLPRHESFTAAAMDRPETARLL